MECLLQYMIKGHKGAEAMRKFVKRIFKRKMKFQIILKENIFNNYLNYSLLVKI